MSEPTPEDIQRFNDAAEQYATEAGIPLEEAKANLGALLENMSTDPTSTALFFARTELANNTRFDDLERRVAHLEEIGGGTAVGPQ